MTKEEKQKLITEIRDAIEQHDYDRAVRIRCRFGAEHSIGLNCSWDENEVKRSVRLLHEIETASPKILSDLTSEELHTHRKLAMVRELSQTITRGMSIPDLPNSSKYDTFSIINMLVSHALNKIALDVGDPLYDDLVLKIHVYNCNDDHVCDYCRSIQNEKFSSLNELPELPFKECTSRNGCRCNATAHWSITKD